VSKINWTTQAPAPIGRRILILKPGEGASVVFLADHIGVNIHWIDNRSRPCVDDCQHCKAQTPRRWRAYLPALVRRCVKMGVDADARQTPVFSARIEELVIELTESHADQIEGLAGMAAELWKPRGNKLLPVRLIVDGPAKVELPPAFDVKPVLYRIWGIQQQERPALKVHHA
jgi:hypothetical protein